MANAAAKKAAAAREAAASTYFPLVAGSNLVYLLLQLTLRWDSLTTPRGCLAAIALVGLSCLAYKGILEDHANVVPRGKGGSEALAGGASLDLLGLVVAVQYGTIFVSEKVYWLMALLPLWGGWKLYSTFFGSKGVASGFMPNDPIESPGDTSSKADSDKAKEKRQKRAERRRQKWS